MSREKKWTLGIFFFLISMAFNMSMLRVGSIADAPEV